MGTGVTYQGGTSSSRGAAAFCCVWSVFTALALFAISAPLRFQQTPPALQWEFEDGFTVGADPSGIGFESVISLSFTAGEDLLVLDGQGGRILRFDSLGQATGQIGARGEGPGEFGAPLFISVAESGFIFVLDAAGWRLSRFLPNGDFDDSWPLEIAGAPAALAIVDDQALIQINPLPIDVPGWPNVSSTRIVAWGEEFTGQRVVWEFEDLGSRPESAAGALPSMPPMFSPTAVWGRLPGNRIALGRTDEYSLAIINLEGERGGTLTREVAPVAVTEEFKDSMRSGLSSLGNERLADSIRFAEFFPMVTRVLEGPADTTVVIRPGADTGNAASGAQWDVFDAEGNYLGTVESPAGFAPFATKGNLVAGTQDDPAENVVRVLRIRVR